MNKNARTIVRPFYRLILQLIRLNILKTIYFNFRCFPFPIAVKLPVYLYGSVKIHKLNGKVKINAPIKTGMIRIGYRWLDLFPSSCLPTQLWISGLLSFKGECIISGGVGLFPQIEQSSINIGKNVCIGGGTFIKSLDKLSIGDNTRITGNCIIMNCEMHYVKNIDTGRIQKNRGSIVIGRNCWINSGTTIAKGSIIPDYSITARNSFINKDFSSYNSNAFIVGSPAVVKSSKVQRIFSIKKERNLDKFFNENPNSHFYDDGIGLCNEEIDFNML